MAELIAPPPTVAWEALRRSLTVLRLLVRECGRMVLSEPSPTNTAGPVARTTGDGTVGQDALISGAPFHLGGHGILALSSFLTGPLLMLVPSLTFVSSRLAKPNEAGKHGLRGPDM